MKKNSMFTKGLSIVLAMLMVLTTGVVGLTPIAVRTNAEVSKDVAQGAPVFSLKWNVPESIYLKPGSGDFQYFLTNTLTATGANADKQAATSASVTVDAPLAKSLSLSYTVEDGKTPAGATASASGISFDIANGVTGTTELETVLTGKKMIGYSNALAGNEYYIKWTLTFEIEVDGETKTLTDTAYTSVYVPFLGQAGSSLYSKYTATLSWTPPRNWVYTFVTGGHSVSGGNYKSNYLSNDVAALESNKTLASSQCGSAAFIAPLVKFTGGNPGGKDSGGTTSNVDYPFAGGGTIPWGSTFYNNYAVSQQSGGGVYVAENEHKKFDGWNASGADNLGQLNITVDTSRFTNFKDIPNLSVGMAQYRWEYDATNRLRWIGILAPNTNPSFSEDDLSGASLKNGIGSAVDFSAQDYSDVQSNAIGLYKLQITNNTNIAGGVYKILFAYRNAFSDFGADWTAQQRSGVVSGVKLSVTETGKAALRNAVYNAYVSGYGYKSDSGEDVMAYFNAVAAGSKVLADQFATAAEITTALGNINNALKTDVKNTITGYTKFSADKYDRVAFNVPEAVYLNITANASSTYDYKYILDQNMTVAADVDKDTGALTGMHTATLAPNAIRELTSSAPGKIQFYYAGVDTTKPVTLTCSDPNNVTFTPLTLDSSTGIYNATLKSGTHAYSSAYINWYVTYTDTVDGYQKTVSAKTYIYAPYDKAVAAVAIGNNTRGYRAYSATATAIFGIHEVQKSDASSIIINSASFSSTSSNISERKTGTWNITLANHASNPSAYTGSTGTDNYITKESGYTATSKGGAAYIQTAQKSGTDRPAITVGGLGKIYYDPARTTTLAQIPNLFIHNYFTNVDDEHKVSAIKNVAGAAAWYLNDSQNATKNSVTYDNGPYNYIQKEGASIYRGTEPSFTGVEIGDGYVLYNQTYRSWTRDPDIGSSGSSSASAFVGVEFTAVDKTSLRAKIMEAQGLMAKYGVYYNGTAYDSLYYNKANTKFAAFMNAYDAALTAQARVDAAIGEEINNLTTAIENLETAIADATKENASAEAKAILKPAVAKLYNVSYDASVDKKLRTIPAFESVKTNEKYNVSFNAKDTVYYSTEDYTGYTFLGFVKSTTDLSAATINGSAIVGTPSYISASDYKQQPMTVSSSSSFGTAAAVGYPSTAPTFTDDNEFHYANTVDPAIYMVGLYQPNHYTIKYDLNGSTDTAPDAVNAVYDVTYTAAASTGITLRGYTFAGWNTAADGTGTSYAAGADLVNLTAENGGIVTLYAQWEEDETQIAHYTVQILLKDASGDTYSQYGNLIEGTGIIGDTLSLSTARSGMIFETAEPAGYTVGTNTVEYTLTDGMEIILKYNRNTYKVTFYGADNTTKVQETDVVVGASYSAPASNPKKTGYVNQELQNETGYSYYKKGHYSFVGWATTPNATTALTEFPVMGASNVSYYPVFTVVDHSFSLVFSQGTSCTSGAYDTYRCDCGYEYNTAAGPVGAHDFDNGTVVSETPATCTAGGAKIVKCKNCDATTTIPTDALGHSLDAKQRVEPTCTATGTEAYYECSRCHAKFSDATGTTPIEAPKAIPATGHDYSVSEYKWSDDGATCTATLVCANDGSHKIVDRECTVNNKSTTEAECEKNATVTKVATVSVDKANDKNEKDASFTNEKTFEIANTATGHDWGDPTYLWSEDKTTCNAYFVCDNNPEHTKTVACEVTAETTDPTGGNDGYTEYTATVTEDGETYTSEPQKVVDEDSAVGYDVIVNFQFADGSKAAEPIEKHYEPTDLAYSINAASVPGYTPNQSVVSGTFAKTDTTKTFTVTYTANTNTEYTVKHYQQNADGAGYTEVEADRQTLTGTTGDNTNAAAKTYTGFTAKTFTQTVIKGDNSAVVSIYYDRDVYTVSWTIGDGATVTGETASVLYGNDIDFTVAYGTGYDQVKPAVTVSGGTLTGTYKVTAITGNVTINVPTQKNKYAVTTSGDAGVTVSAGKTVEYLDSYVLTVTAKENYTQTAPTATVNGAALALVKGEGNTYTATIANIAEAKAIVVTSTIDSHKLTITYKYADNTEAKPTVSKDVNYGASYSETCPTIDKFVPVIVIGDTNVVTNKVEGTMDNADVTVNVVYLADENGNGTPDVDDSKLTVTFDYGRYGTAVSGQVYAAKVLPNTAYAAVAKPTVNAKDGFTFKGWKDPGVTTVTGDITVYAEYTTKDENGDDITVDENTYLIKFVNYDGTLLKAVAADAGDTIAAPADPTRGDFTFAGWTPEVKTTVEGDATYTATFKTAKTEGGTEEIIGANESVVSFYNFDGTLIKAEFVENGKTVSAPEIPDREGFTKNGWTPAFDAAVAVTKDAAYTASYKTALTEGGAEEEIPAGKYVIKFYTFDGKLLASFVKAEGETFEAPAVPERANTTSKAWAPTVKTTVDGDAVYTATYKTKLDPDSDTETEIAAGSFVISFYTYDDKLIERKIVAENGEVIAPEAPDRGDFTFAGWAPTFAEKATEDVQYKATYKTKLNPTDAEETLIPDGEFVVSFVNYDGKLVEAKFVADGETTTAPATNPTRANCTFKAWDPAFSETTPVTEDKTYTATYTTIDDNGDEIDVEEGKFVVKFFNYDNSLLKTFVVDDGEKVTAPTATRGDFTFAGWTPVFNADTAVTADASYKATFKTALVPGGAEQIIPDGFVAVRFLTYKGELIKAEFVLADSTVPAAPTAPARAQCTFAGWDPAYKNTDTVDADIDYKATYKTVLVPGGEEQLIPEDMFVVRFVDAKDALISAVFVAKNGTATAPDMDGTADYFDEEGHYGFNEWNKAFDNITADTTVKAQYGFTAHTLADKDIVDASCLVNGSKTVYCTGCGYEKKNVVIPAPGHNVVTDEAVAPTCTGTGFTEGSHCSVCNTVIVAQKPIAATGHSFGKWTLVKAATDTEEGIMKRVCSVCTYEETKTYSKSDEYLEIDHSVILPYGESIEIPVYRMPAGTLEDVTWTSDNVYIAAPDDDGKIMIIGIGEVTLTATTADGLTISKTFYINDKGNTKVVRFMGIDKMSYIVAGYFHIYNVYDFRWAKGADLRFRVNPYSNFPYPDFVIRVDGVKLEADADGSYTIPGSDANVVVTIEGAMVDPGTGKKLSFWDMLINFFRKIIDFFSNLFK